MFIYKIALLTVVSEENDVENQLKTLIDYLGYTNSPNIRFSPENKIEDEILNSILSAVKDKKKFFIEVVKSFDLQNLNAVLVYLYRQLIKNEIPVKLLRDLDYTTMGTDSRKGHSYIYMITEKYLNLSDEETLKKLAVLMSGHMPGELRGIPVILALTENGLKLVEKYRSDNNSEFINIDKSGKNLSSPLVGTAFLLFSLTFLITFVGLIVDRPRVLFLSISVVTWIIFAESLMAISGFILLIAGSMKLPLGKAKLISGTIILIALLEIVSVYLQLSGFSISPIHNGLHLESPYAVGPNYYTSAGLENALLVPIIYSSLSIILAFTFYLLFYGFATEFYRRVGIFALLTAVTGEMISAGYIYINLSLHHLQAFVFGESHLLFVSFYNNISPLMPYPSMLLNTSDFLFPFGKVSIYIFYLMLVIICASNFLFFISYLGTALGIYRKKEYKENDETVTGN